MPVVPPGKRRPDRLARVGGRHNRQRAVRYDDRHRGRLEPSQHSAEIYRVGPGCYARHRCAARVPGSIVDSPRSTTTNSAGGSDRSFQRTRFRREVWAPVNDIKRARHSAAVIEQEVVRALQSGVKTRDVNPAPDAE